MKRLVTLMMVGAMTFMLSGCGQEAPKQPEVTPEATVESVAKPEVAAEPAAAPAAAESDTNATDADKAAGATTQE